MKTVTLLFPNQASAKQALFTAMMHGVVTHSDDIADGYLDIQVPNNRTGVLQYMAIKAAGRGRKVAVVEHDHESGNMGPVRDSTKFERLMANVDASVIAAGIATLAKKNK